jgi:hypothetical protein
VRATLRERSLACAAPSVAPGHESRLFRLGLIARGHRRALPRSGEEALADFARAECRRGDLLVCLGAASISACASALPERPNASNHHKKPVDG